MEPLTDLFLRNIKKAPNLAVLKIPSYSHLSNVGLKYLEKAPCIKKLEIFSFESGVIWSAVHDVRTRPIPTYTELGICRLLKAMSSLKELSIDIVDGRTATENVLLNDVEVFHRLCQLSSLHLSGLDFADTEFLHRLTSCSLTSLKSRQNWFKVLDIEADSSKIRISDFASLVNGIGSQLRELRICVNGHSSAPKYGDQIDASHHIVRYSSFARYAIIILTFQSQE